jgi:dTDP-glucose 4,6-dehydratase
MTAPSWESSRSLKIIVTGGAGFIGSAVCRYLVSSGCEVINVDKLTYAGTLTSLASIAHHPRYRFVRADVCDRHAMVTLVETEKPDAIMHLAAETHVDRSIAAAATFIDTNIIGTLSMLEAARSYLARVGSRNAERFRFLHVSTDEVYGSLGPDGLFTETTRYDPSSPYSASKAGADHLAMAWYRTYDLPVVISNCSNNYGPYQFPEKLIPLTILNAIDGEPVPLYGDGSNVRDWLYVEDHAQALCLIACRGRPGQKYNVGGRGELSNLQVVRRICGILDRVKPSAGPYDRLISFVTDRPGHDKRYAIDCSRIECELGWRAKETFASGIEKTVRWYLENEWWWRPLREKTLGGERGAAVEGRREL